MRRRKDGESRQRVIDSVDDRWRTITELRSRSGVTLPLARSYLRELYGVSQVERRSDPAGSNSLQYRRVHSAACE